MDYLENLDKDENTFKVDRWLILKAFLQIGGQGRESIQGVFDTIL